MDKIYIHLRPPINRRKLSWAFRIFDALEKGKKKTIDINWLLAFHSTKEDTVTTIYDGRKEEMCIAARVIM
jgi:hypothetical protein